MRKSETIIKICEYCNNQYECLDKTINKNRKYCSNNCRIFSHKKLFLQVRGCDFDKKLKYKCSQCSIKKDCDSFYFKKDNHRFSTKCKDCYGNLNKYIPKIFEVKVDGEKICSKCGKLKFLIEYHICKKHTDGRESCCKSCKNVDKIKRLKTDLNFRILENCRKRVRDAMKGKDKSARTLELIGGSVELLRNHLESKFTEGMTWDNYGEWHIDHIIPCAKFDLTNYDEQRKCFHYSNTQPLWAADNIKKSDKIGQEFNNDN